MPKAKTAQSRAETTEQLAPSGAGNKENSLLQFDVRIQSIRPRESIKGTASVNINGAFAIRGVKIIEGSNGLFVSMPSYKVGNEYIPGQIMLAVTGAIIFVSTACVIKLTKPIEYRT